MLREEKCLEFVFEGRERLRVSDILGQIVPDMRTEIGERVKAMNRWSLSMCVFFLFFVFFLVLLPLLR